METEKPTISAVITCYREGKLIFDAVNSILNQSILPLEIVIVNDASTDPATITVCQKLEQNPLIQVIWRITNGGPSVARDDGFRAAKGEILVPLDADDLLPENALELIVNAFQDMPDTGFIYGNYVRQEQANTEGIEVNTGDISLQSALKARHFSLSTNWRLHGSSPIRRSLWKTLGGYDPNFGTKDLHDVEFWIRVIASGCAYQYIPEVIYIWRKYLGSNSRQVTPISWYRIAQKYFDVYKDLGLEYRANELLLLGSKWLNQDQDIRNYSQKLWKFLWSRQIHFSTLVAIAIPSQILRLLANWHRR